MELWHLLGNQKNLSWPMHAFKLTCVHHTNTSMVKIICPYLLSICLQQPIRTTCSKSYLDMLHSTCTMKFMATTPLSRMAAYMLFRTLPANVSRPYHLLRLAPRIAKEVTNYPPLPISYFFLHAPSLWSLLCIT